jgi:hypothetical protein
MRKLGWFVGVGLSLCLAGNTHAATVIWGGGTGAWGTAANWIGGAVPGTGDTASFTGWVPMPRTGWTVTASTGALPTNAVDGSWNTRWTTNTAATSGQYLQIDLGSTQTFSRIVLDCTGDANDFPPGYDVYVSTNGSAWGSPIATGTGTSALTTIDFTPQTARYARIQLNANGTNWWSVKEAFVYRTAATDDTQLARSGWTLSASNNTANAGNAIDASLATRWDSGTNAANGQWFKIDLGAQTTFNRVDFSSYTSQNDFPPAWKIQVSTDDVTYGSSVATGLGAVGFVSATFSAQTARYILITCTLAGQYYWSIHDLNVYGTPRAATLSSTTTIAALTLPKSSITLASGAALTVSGAATLTGGTFNVGAGTGTFQSAPTLTSGTFAIGSGGRAIFSQSTTFSSGVTLTFPASAGRLSVAQGKTLTLSGPVTAATTSGATKPKIDCSGCSATQGVTIAFTSSSTLNLDGLEFQSSAATGVSIASGATLTALKNLSFKNNAANGGAGTHLALTLGAATVNAPGCVFDATAATNVALYGTAGNVRGARVILEYQSASVNGAGAGEAKDADGDDAPGDANPGNNYGENTAAPYYGSVVQWSSASVADTAGAAEGAPTAAFDWNTFAYYGVYVQYKNVSGAGTADRLWSRNSDGSARYSFDVPNSSGDLVGSPQWSTANEVTLGLDVNGDGDMTDTSVHVVYLATTTGRIIKLIDTGTALARPASGAWATDFTSSGVTSISSPLITDSSNLYFGGADNLAVSKIFGVQVIAGPAEKTLVKNIGSVGTVTAALSWKRFGGRVYLYVGSTAFLGMASLYRVEVSPGAVVQATYNSLTSSVNGSVRVNGTRAYAVTSGGQLYALDATNTGTGGFTTLTGFPYQTAAASPIQAPAYTDSNTGVSFFGDDTGRLYSVTSAGAATSGYPYVVTSAAITSSPLYISGSGVVALGAADGYLYFVDRRNAAGNPSLFNRYYVGTGAVSWVAYDANSASYMVSSQDGKLSFVARSLVSDPTAAYE